MHSWLRGIALLLPLVTMGCFGVYDLPEHIEARAPVAPSPDEGARIVGAPRASLTCRPESGRARACPAVLPPGVWHVRPSSSLSDAVAVSVPHGATDLRVQRPTRANRSASAGLIAAGILVGAGAVLVLGATAADGEHGRLERETQNYLLAGSAGLLGLGAVTAAVSMLLTTQVGAGSITLAPRAP